MKRGLASWLILGAVLSAFLTGCGTKNGTDLKVTELPDDTQSAVQEQGDDGQEQSDLIALLLPDITLGQRGVVSQLPQGCVTIDCADGENAQPMLRTYQVDEKTMVLTGVLEEKITQIRKAQAFALSPEQQVIVWPRTGQEDTADIICILQ